MRISDWSSDVCSSDLRNRVHVDARRAAADRTVEVEQRRHVPTLAVDQDQHLIGRETAQRRGAQRVGAVGQRRLRKVERGDELVEQPVGRSEEHTSELQSLMRISYAVFRLKKKMRKPRRIRWVIPSTHMKSLPHSTSH